MTLAITNPQNIPFSMIKPTQTSEKTVRIQQSGKGLKMTIESQQGKTYVIPKDCIQGLPKQRPIPKEFFENCHVCLKEKSLLIYSRLKGGGGLNSKIEIKNNPSSSRMAAPDKLRPVNKRAKRLAEDIGLIEKKYGEGVYKFKNPPKFFFVEQHMIRETSFHAHINPDIENQLVWKAYCYANSDEIGSIVKGSPKDLGLKLLERGHSIHINTGSHGDLRGRTVWDVKGDEQKVQELAASEFLNEDIESVLKLGNVSLSVISTYHPPHLPPKSKSCHRCLVLQWKETHRIISLGENNRTYKRNRAAESTTPKKCLSERSFWAKTVGDLFWRCGKSARTSKRHRADFK